MKHLIWIAITAALLSFTAVEQFSQAGNADHYANEFSHRKTTDPAALQDIAIAGLYARYNEPVADVPAGLKKDTTVVFKGFTQTGNASYYANKFHGRRTSSGAVYHKDSLTAAHKTLKFGTLLKVTNLVNDSVVIVKVTDRMGRSSHIIDLSYAGAKQLNFIRNGVAKVRIEEIQK